MKIKQTIDHEQFLRILTNSWAVLTLFIFWLDFYSLGKYDQLASPVGIIYVGILSIYAGEKEFDRWQKHHKSRFRGEMFVLIWTISITFMAISSIITKGYLSLPKDTASIYTGILAIFAISQKSKSLFREKLKEDYQNKAENTK